MGDMQAHFALDRDAAAALRRALVHARFMVSASMWPQAAISVRYREGTGDDARIRRIVNTYAPKAVLVVRDVAPHSVWGYRKGEV